MRILVAGATGVIGRPLVGALRARGHHVSALVREESRERAPEADAVVVADALDREALTAAVAEARPEVVVHQMAALREMFTNPVDAFTATARLRTEGTANLIAAARAAGARRMVAQSVAFAAAPTGDTVVDEDVPLWVDAPDPGWAATVRALADLESQVLGAAPDVSGVVLRYGSLYGPGTAYARTGASAQFVLAGKMPLPEGGAGVTSFLHVEDAVGATVTAVESEATGVFHITDDEPAPAAEWLPHFVQALGAPQPPSIPVASAARLLGWFAAHQLTAAAGASNARAGEGLGWKPLRPSWRDGLGEE